jgi:hypothetical protein
MPVAQQCCQSNSRQLSPTRRSSDEPWKQEVIAPVAPKPTALAVDVTDHVVRGEEDRAEQGEQRCDVAASVGREADGRRLRIVEVRLNHDPQAGL